MVLWLSILILHIWLCLSFDPARGHLNATTEPASDTNRVQSFEEIVFAGISRIHREFPDALPVQIIARASLTTTRTLSPQDFVSFEIYSRTMRGIIDQTVCAEKPERGNWRGPVPSTPPRLQVVLWRFTFDREAFPIKMQRAFAFVEAAGFGNDWEAVHVLHVNDIAAAERWQQGGYVFGFTRNRDRSPAMVDFVFVSAFSGSVLTWDNDGRVRFNASSSPTGTF